MSAAYSPGARAGRIELHYYACAARLGRRGCRAPYVRVEEADAAVAALVHERLAELRIELSRAPAPAAAEERDIDAERSRIEARRQRVLDRLEDGTMPAADARARLARIEAQREAIEAHAVARARQVAATTPAARRSALAQTAALARAWAGATPEERRRIVAILAERVELARGTTPRITWRSTLEL